MGFTDCFGLVSIINGNLETCPLLTTIAYSIRGFQTRSRQLKVGKMIDENLEIRPLLIPTVYSIGVGSGGWGVVSGGWGVGGGGNCAIPRKHSLKLL